MSKCIPLHGDRLSVRLRLHCNLSEDNGLLLRPLLWYYLIQCLYSLVKIFIFGSSYCWALRSNLTQAEAGSVRRQAYMIKGSNKWQSERRQTSLSFVLIMYHTGASTIYRRKRDQTNTRPAYTYRVNTKRPR